jgi:hypothetical protein
MGLAAHLMGNNSKFATKFIAFFDDAKNIVPNEDEIRRIICKITFFCLVPN